MSQKNVTTLNKQMAEFWRIEKSFTMTNKNETYLLEVASIRYANAPRNTQSQNDDPIIKIILLQFP